MRREFYNTNGQFLTACNTCYVGACDCPALNKDGGVVYVVKYDSRIDTDRVVIINYVFPEEFKKTMVSVKKITDETTLEILKKLQDGEQIGQILKDFCPCTPEELAKHYSRITPYNAASIYFFKHSIFFCGSCSLHVQRGIKDCDILAKFDKNHIFYTIDKDPCGRLSADIHIKTDNIPKEHKHIITTSYLFGICARCKWHGTAR